MTIYFLRHGDAEPGGPRKPDFDRRLTIKGQTISTKETKTLRKLQVKPEVILTSPYARALQTAQIVADGLECPLVEVKELGCGCSLDHLMDALKAAGSPETVMVVGHEPDFSTMIEQTTGAEVEMKKGGVACVDLYRPVARRGILLWLMSGKLLAELA